MSAIMLQDSYHLQEELIEWRRDLHMHPELGFKEIRTASRVAQELEKLGYRVRRNIGRTGVMAEIGSPDGPCMAIRADMDALPILEANDVPYRSQVDGNMHACGHDAHTAMALGAATLLARRLPAGALPFQPSAKRETAIAGLCILKTAHVDMSSLYVDPASLLQTIAPNKFRGVFLGSRRRRRGAKRNETIDPFYLPPNIVAPNGIVPR
jgi:hypothetical protein